VLTPVTVESIRRQVAESFGPRWYHELDISTDHDHPSLQLQVCMTSSPPPRPNPEENWPDAAAARPRERRPAMNPRDLTRRTRARTGKLFTRRELLSVGGVSLVGGALVSLPLLLGSDSNGDADPAPREAALGANAPPASTTDVAASPTPATASTPVVQRDPTQSLVETSVAGMQGYIARGEVTSRSLVEAAQARVAQYDELYGAMIEMNPDALEIAQRLDDELARGKSRGPLHGIPVMLKDLIATGDAMRTTSGALALGDTPVAEDARIVQRLREAGAIILGKNNMTEWSNIRSYSQVGGWSDRGGMARNPYNSNMATWGSSSGSAAGVALSYAPLSIGAETNGSILCPAAACGVIGFKPTVGLVSRVGAMPVSTTLDSLGPIGRSVADVAALMNVIAGYDPDDPAFGEMGWISPAATVGGSPVHAYDEVDYLQALDAGGLRGARIGVCWGLWGMDSRADAVAEEVIYQLEAAGAELVLGVEISSLAELRNAPQLAIMVNTEFSSGMADFFARFTPEGPVTSLQDVVDWNNAHPDVALAMNDQEGLVEAVVPLSLDDPGYLDVVANMIEQARGNGLDAALDGDNLDVLVAPTAPVPTEIVEGVGASFAGASSEASAHAGYPSITVPAGYVDGLPVGLHFMGRAFDERLLLRIAYATEQLLQARVPPEP